MLNRVIERGLVADGRLFRFITTISDHGSRAERRRSKVIAGTGASIKEITHDRTFCAADVSAVQVSCVVETRDQAHIEALRKALAAGGGDQKASVGRWGSGIEELGGGWSHPRARARARLCVARLSQAFSFVPI